MRFNQSFQMQVMTTFAELYGVERSGHISSFRERELSEGEMRSDADGEWTIGCVGETFENVDEVQKGIKELQVSKPNAIFRVQLM